MFPKKQSRRDWWAHGTYLSSVLSAREMAGFLTALLHAWLLLHTHTDNTALLHKTPASFFHITSGEASVNLCNGVLSYEGALRHKRLFLSLLDAVCAYLPDGPVFVVQPDNVPDCAMMPPSSLWNNRRSWCWRIPAAAAAVLVCCTHFKLIGHFLKWFYAAGYIFTFFSLPMLTLFPCWAAPAVRWRCPCRRGGRCCAGTSGAHLPLCRTHQTPLEEKKRKKKCLLKMLCVVFVTQLRIKKEKKLFLCYYVQFPPNFYAFI